MADTNKLEDIDRPASGSGSTIPEFPVGCQRIFGVNCCRKNLAKWKKKKATAPTYRHTLAADAVHDTKRGAQIRMPCFFQFVDLFSEMAICKESKTKFNSSTATSDTDHIKK